ncbi:Panacea domain-containing protein [Pedobacter metabolipauper]|uniref:Putative phage-associated protein n=1 Tax=Pedobacter metabolipauper TaxID=425513 RepID=A0A4R6T1F4_9SPHI|nr:type II toxin-antitoxin system antitoxin SocA domain-containing protein [Pedobacter metabolipauper]TDQ11899.1 putative phage-associated protein [Pedobacter metabolipauper]
MSYPAIVVANELIKLSLSEEIPITPMKLQKMVYLANGISLKRKGEKLVNERFEAWDYGPVVTSIYHDFKEYSGNVIPEPKNVNIFQDGSSFANSSSIIVNDEDLKIIKEAWDNAKNIEAIALSAWSHNKNSPWDKAYHSKPKSVYISDDHIKAYFEDFIKN